MNVQNDRRTSCLNLWVDLPRVENYRSTSDAVVDFIFLSVHTLYALKSSSSVHIYLRNIEYLNANGTFKVYLNVTVSIKETPSHMQAKWKIKLGISIEAENWSFFLSLHLLITDDPTLRVFQCRLFHTILETNTILMKCETEPCNFYTEKKNFYTSIFWMWIYSNIPIYLFFFLNWRSCDK